MDTEAWHRLPLSNAQATKVPNQYTRAITKFVKNKLPEHLLQIKKWSALWAIIISTLLAEYLWILHCILIIGSYRASVNRWSSRRKSIKFSVLEMLWVLKFIKLLIQRFLHCLPGGSWWRLVSSSYLV